MEGLVTASSAAATNAALGPKSLLFPNPTTAAVVLMSVGLTATTGLTAATTSRGNAAPVTVTAAAVAGQARHPRYRPSPLIVLGGPLPSAVRAVSPSAVSAASRRVRRLSRIRAAAYDPANDAANNAGSDAVLDTNERPSEGDDVIMAGDRQSDAMPGDSLATAVNGLVRCDRDGCGTHSSNFCNDGGISAMGADVMMAGRNAAVEAASWTEQHLGGTRDGIEKHFVKRLGFEQLLALRARSRGRDSWPISSGRRGLRHIGDVTSSTLQGRTVTLSMLQAGTVTSRKTEGGMWGYNSVGHERHVAMIVMFVLALSICLWIDSSTAADLLVAGIRAAVQLSAVGFGLQYIFAIESTAVAYSGVAIMVLAAAHTASRRAKGVSGGFWVALLAVGTAVTSAFLLLTVLQVVRLWPRFVIPIGGIVVGSSMTIAANTMQRLADDFEQRRGQVEAALALGASQWQASLPLVRRALAVGFGPTLDYIKTYGVIQLPGAMVGMLMGGVPPQEAVYLQLTVTFFLLVPLALSTVVSAVFTARKFFSAPGQLAEEGWGGLQYS
ncbi:hypothetical protein CLOM_g13352 [Closterium sp. NIES-68]|nr:hypothetical protein CLOM_g13352 [Closterium sp. NIES-68]GJP60529.1 hypothetical protein CLOP_g17773 [Closterium sp. NIES-67]